MVDAFSSTMDTRTTSVSACSGPFGSSSGKPSNRLPETAPLSTCRKLTVVSLLAASTGMAKLNSIAITSNRESRREDRFFILDLLFAYLPAEPACYIHTVSRGRYLQFLKLPERIQLARQLNCKQPLQYTIRIIARRLWICKRLFPKALTFYLASLSILRKPNMHRNAKSQGPLSGGLHSSIFILI